MNISWETVSTSGPPVAHHAGCLVSGQFYIHGGIIKSGSTQPSNQFHRFDLQTTTWTNLTNSDSPYLSHHASVAIDNRYFVTIGGWDGRTRCSEVYIYDTEKSSWSSKAVTDGFPQGAGLSSHTAVALTNGEVLIIGREGSLRTQRRSGNSFLLKGNPGKGTFVYSCYPISVTSRSGHSTTGTGSKVVTIGGRDDKIIEQYPGFKTLETRCNLISRIAEKCGNPSSKLPSRKNHVAVLGKDCIFLHGGETFDGRNRNPVGEMFLVLLKPHLTFRSLGNASVCRAGHVACWNEDMVFIHGGFDEKHLPQGSIHSLHIS